MVRAARLHAVARSPLNPPAFPRSDERKVFDGPSELQLDCVVEESSRSAPLKLALTDLSRPDDFPAPPQNGPTLPVEPSDIKLDPAAADMSAGSGERTVAGDVDAPVGPSACIFKIEKFPRWLKYGFNDAVMLRSNTLFYGNMTLELWGKATSL